MKGNIYQVLKLNMTQEEYETISNFCELLDVYHDYSNCDLIDIYNLIFNIGRKEKTANDFEINIID